MMMHGPKTCGRIAIYGQILGCTAIWTGLHDDTGQDSEDEEGFYGCTAIWAAGQDYTDYWTGLHRLLDRTRMKVSVKVSMGALPYGHA